jgi:hypothetical protein
MTETLCGYPGRDDIIVTYLYDGLDDGARSAFDAHVAICSQCRNELEALRGVRTHLARWEPPARTVGVPLSFVTGRPDAVGDQEREFPPVKGSWWREMPAWAQVAAAILCLGVGAGLANLDIRYDPQGLSIRTGWSRARTEGQAPAARAAAVAPAPIAAASSPWRADLTTLERQLRTEFQAARSTAADTATVGAPAQPSMSDAELLRRVRVLVDDSERRQQRELALRVGQLLRDVNAQRQADLRKIDSNLGFIQSNTGAEVMKQRQLLMNYIVRASSQK